MTDSTPEAVIDGFLAAFASKDVENLRPYLDPDIEFFAYGDAPTRGSEAVLAIWRSVFASMAHVDFTTVHRAVNGEWVLEEQIHALGLPGRSVAPIGNMAVYQVRDGRITQWRDYTDSAYARTLL